MRIIQKRPEKVLSAENVKKTKNVLRLTKYALALTAVSYTHL